MRRVDLDCNRMQSTVSIELRASAGSIGILYAISPLVSIFIFMFIFISVLYYVLPGVGDTLSEGSAGACVLWYRFWSHLVVPSKNCEKMHHTRAAPVIQSARKLLALREVLCLKRSIRGTAM